MILQLEFQHVEMFIYTPQLFFKNWFKLETLYVG